MTQQYLGLDQFTYYGDEDPNGWFLGENGLKYIDYQNNVYYQWKTGTTWIRFINAESLIPYAKTADVNTSLNLKVDKVTGKGLSTEDYTTTEKSKLASLANQVNSDWNSTSGLAQILNKPSIPSKILISAPVSRTLSKATAYQATDNTKPAIFNITLTSTSSISLSGSVNNSANIVLGSTNAVASGTGTVVGKYNNTLGGTLVVGLNLTNTATNTYTISVPIGYYFSINQTVGTGITIDSVTEQVQTISA